MSKKPDLDFKSKEEFRAVCQYLSARLGYLNRTAMGEKALVIAVSEALRGIGRAFEQHYDDKDVNAAFGDGWTPGTIEREDRVAALMDLAFPPEED